MSVLSIILEVEAEATDCVEVGATEGVVVKVGDSGLDITTVESGWASPGDSIAPPTLEVEQLAVGCV